MDGKIIESPRLERGQIVITTAFADARVRVKSTRRGVWGAIVGAPSRDLLRPALDIATAYAREHAADLEPLFLALERGRH